jgi:hypothetical protein
MRPHWAARKFPDVVAILCGDDRACGLAFPNVELAKITVIHTVTMCRSDMARLEEHAFAWALFSPDIEMCRSSMVRSEERGTRIPSK